MDVIDNDNVTNPIILDNTRVLPVPATSGSTGQSHSNNKTNGKTGIELGLECVLRTSARFPSGVPQSQHTPTGNVEKVIKESSLQLVENNSDILPIEIKSLPIIKKLPEPTLEINHYQLNPISDLLNN